MGWGCAGALDPAPAAIENRPGGPLRAEQRGQERITGVGGCRTVRLGAGGFGFSGGVGGWARFLFRGLVRSLPVALFSLVPGRARVRTGLRLGGRAGRTGGCGLSSLSCLGQAVAGFLDAETVPGLPRRAEA